MIAFLCFLLFVIALKFISKFFKALSLILFELEDALQNSQSVKERK
jgi:hypothetical protein